jgi:hypothetical protein
VWKGSGLFCVHRGWEKALGVIRLPACCTKKLSRSPSWYILSWVVRCVEEPKSSVSGVGSGAGSGKILKGLRAFFGVIIFRRLLAVFSFRNLVRRSVRSEGQIVKVILGFGRCKVQVEQFGVFSVICSILLVLI